MSPAEKLCDRLQKRERADREVELRKTLAAAHPEPEVIDLMELLKAKLAEAAR